MNDLQRLIVDKWYLPLEKLAQRSDICFKIIKRAVRGEEIGYQSEAKLRKFFENYEGEEG